MKVKCLYCGSEFDFDKNKHKILCKSCSKRYEGVVTSSDFSFVKYIENKKRRFNDLFEKVYYKVYLKIKIGITRGSVPNDILDSDLVYSSILKYVIEKYSDYTYNKISQEEISRHIFIKITKGEK